MRYDHAELVRLVSAAESLILIFMGIATALGFFGFGLFGVALGKGVGADGLTGFLVGGFVGATVTGGLAWLSTLMLRIYLQVALAQGEMSFYTAVLLKLTKFSMGIKPSADDGQSESVAERPTRATTSPAPKPVRRRPSVADCAQCGCPLTPGIEFCEQCGHQA